MKQNNLTTLEIYINRVFKLIIVIIPSIALSAGLTFSVLHALGYYSDVPMTVISVFDLTCILYSVIGIRFTKKCEDEDGFIKTDSLKRGKIFLAILMCVQWNFITYMIPSRDFWAYSFFFVLLSAFFLDSKYVLVIISEITLSTVISWIVRPNELLPVRDELFVPEMVLRGVLMVLCFSTIWLLTFTIEKGLAKELEKISDFDTLTLLYNRRKLEKYYESAVSQIKQGGHFSVIMSDIDDFKNVNDTYGHSCGDEILKKVAGIIRNVSESNGIAFRYGGEEILILVYDNEEKAVLLAEEIRKRVESCNTVYDENIINVTLTLGVTECRDTDSFENLIKRADANLYYGKSHGKNCVIR